MIRLLLTLALIFPLAADATINAASFQREVILCADGTRQARYPAGADTCLPEVTADYTQDWSSFAVSASAYTVINAESDLETNSGSEKTPALDPGAYQIVSTRYRDSTNQKSLLTRNNEATFDTAGKHRVELRYGVGTANFGNIAAVEKVCVGYSMYIDSATWGTSGHSAIAGQWASASPMTMFTFEPYTTEAGVKHSTMRIQHRLGGGYTWAPTLYYQKGSTNSISNATAASRIKLDTWYDIVQEMVYDKTGSAGSWTVSAPLSSAL